MVQFKALLQYNSDLHEVNQKEVHITYFELNVDFP